eukprot:CAMPEP_0172517742 /NCGR_PEP_ID=MMETSP1066-20121228/287593_1 /TAXON_ID=671091 /ORGANISM="Coscinodiscus wailesii, Strain CCMP2513" /LENGTH=344 /DNA_ID=CAMNT_0013299901 /DNA_START=108 /DNA_END=1142 /DNA_ORIENTATION=-
MYHPSTTGAPNSMNHHPTAGVTPTQIYLSPPITSNNDNNFAAHVTGTSVAQHQGLRHRRRSKSSSFPSLWNRGSDRRPFAAARIPGHRQHHSLHAIPRGGSSGNSDVPSSSFFSKSNIPNILTYLRCLAIPLLVYTFYSSLPSRATITSSLFALASLTDWLDGYLARKWNVTSPFGAFLDPVADKLMVSTALIVLAGRFGRIVAIPTSIILAREIAVSALREWMAQRGLRDVVKVGFQGKVKTAATMVALTVLLAVEKAGEGWLWNVGLAGLYFSAFVTVTSGSVYFIAARPVLMDTATTDDGIVKDSLDSGAVTSEPVGAQSVASSVVSQVPDEMAEIVDKDS